jgi:hypothetical protein
MRSRTEFGKLGDFRSNLDKLKRVPVKIVPEKLGPVFRTRGAVQKKVALITPKFFLRRRTRGHLLENFV